MSLFGNWTINVGKPEMRPVLAAVAVVTSAFAILAAEPPKAEAAGCYYRLYHDGHGVVTGKLGIQGYGQAVKMGTACKRARQECNRRFERARKKGNVPRANPRELRCIKMG